MDKIITILTIIITLIIILTIYYNFRKLRRTKYFIIYFLTSVILGLILIILKESNNLNSEFQFYLLSPILLTGFIKICDLIFKSFHKRNLIIYGRGIHLTEDEKQTINNDDKIASIAIYFAILLVPMILAQLTYDLKFINRTDRTYDISISDRLENDEQIELSKKSGLIKIPSNSKKLYYGNFSFRSDLDKNGFLKMHIYDETKNGLEITDTMVINLEKLEFSDYKITIE